MTILLVEDDPGDTMLIQESFKRGGSRVCIEHVTNGEKCLQFLRKEVPYHAAPTPDLLIVDIWLPVMSGLELLKVLRGDDRFRSLPFVVLSASSDGDLIRQMYAMRCSAYIVKPLTFPELKRITAMIAQYWGEAALQPAAVR